MEIQSLSVVVPNKRCINSCLFCVSKMHCQDIENKIGSKNLTVLDEKDYIKRLEFVRDNGCNTVMLTGTSEPQQNQNFLEKFAYINNNLSKPFRWIEMQTTGVLLDNDYLKLLRNEIGVNTISVSLSSLNDEVNAHYSGIPFMSNRAVNLKALCSNIKSLGFNLRVSVNLTDSIAVYKPENLIKEIKKLLNPDQITFRVLYATQPTDEDPELSVQAQWIKEHDYPTEYKQILYDYIVSNGTPLEILPFGAIKYSLEGCSIVFDNDCMSKVPKQQLKYLILQPNCKLYTKWDDEASLVF